MKRILFTILVVTLLAVPCFAQTSDISKVEVKPDVAKCVLDTVKLRAITQTAEITYRKVDSNGDSVGEETTVSFMNTPEETQEQCDENGENCKDVVTKEASTKFTQFINYLQTRISAGDSLKLAITKAVKIELGL